MKIFTDNAVIEKRVNISRWANLVGLGMLFGAVFLSFQQSMLLYSFILLMAGLVVANIGTFFANRWLRRPRADEILSKVLKGFDSQYTLFNYTSPVMHVLMGPDHLYTIVTRFQDGVIRVEGSKFYRKFKWSRLFTLLADETLGNPIQDARRISRNLESYLAKNLNEKIDIPIEPIIIFTNPEAYLTVEDCPVPTMNGSELKNFLRGQPKGTTLNNSQRNALIALLKGSAEEEK
jgi:hypothetical protein